MERRRKTHEEKSYMHSTSSLLSLLLLLFSSRRCLLCAIRRRYLFILISFAIFSRFKWKQICSILCKLPHTIFLLLLPRFLLNVPPPCSVYAVIFSHSRGSETINSWIHEIRSQQIHHIFSRSPFVRFYDFFFWFFVRHLKCNKWLMGYLSIK